MKVYLHGFEGNILILMSRISPYGSNIWRIAIRDVPGESPLTKRKGLGGYCRRKVICSFLFEALEIRLVGELENWMTRSPSPRLRGD